MTRRQGPHKVPVRNGVTLGALFGKMWTVKLGVIIEQQGPLLVYLLIHEAKLKIWK